MITLTSSGEIKEHISGLTVTAPLVLTGDALSIATPLAVQYGGTGLASGTQGAIPYWSATTSLANSMLAQSTQGVSLTLTQQAASSGSPVGLTVTGGAHTTLTASVEAIDVNFALARTVQFAQGALATQRAVVFAAPTYAFATGASTLTTAATVVIVGAPIGGTNATITNAYALWVQAGLTNLAGGLNVTGVVNASTGYEIGGAAASGNYLRGNGTNFVSSAIQAGDLPGLFSGFANPSVSVGLTVVNGSATTAMRSDGAPALSQAIIPTWTAAHTWSTSPTPITITQGAAASGSPTGFIFTGGVHTTLTASVEDIDAYFNLNRTVQFATGSLATQRAVVFYAPTYAFVGASVITTAATVAITGAPIQGANATLTRSHALWVQAGMTTLAGGLNVGSATGATGTGWLYVTQAVSTTDSPSMVVLTGGAHTTLTAGAEAIDVNINLARTVQFTAGDFNTQRAMVIQAPTYSATGSMTITTAVTLDVTGVPVAGSNMSLTRRYALRANGAVLIGAAAPNIGGMVSGVELANTVTTSASLFIGQVLLVSGIPSADANDRSIMGVRISPGFQTVNYTSLKAAGLVVDTTMLGSGTIVEYASVQIAEETFATVNVGLLIGTHPGGSTNYAAYLNSANAVYLGTGVAALGTGIDPVTALNINSTVTAAAGTYAAGMIISVTLTAHANSDAFYNVYSAPVFAKSTFTGLAAYSISALANAPTGSGTIAKYAGVYIIEQTFATANVGLLIGAHPGGSTNYAIYSNSSNASYFGGGLVIGAPTGGDKGAGTINVATNIFKNNTAYTNPDYALEWWATGAARRYEDSPGAKDYRRMSLSELEAYIRKHFRLPHITDEPAGIFDMADIALTLIEELTTHIIELHHRLETLGV